MCDTLNTRIHRSGNSFEQTF